MTSNSKRVSHFVPAARFGNNYDIVSNAKKLIIKLKTDW